MAATLATRAGALACPVRAVVPTKSTFSGRRLAGGVHAGERIVARATWLPGLPPPAYLDGSLPGDYGYDPLGIGEEPDVLPWMVQGELQNGRWAMLGSAGVLIPELLAKLGIWDTPIWSKTATVEYYASPGTLFVVLLWFFHFVETRRWVDIQNPGSVNEDPIHKGYKLPPNEPGYPGGIFNFLNFPTDKEMKTKEINNGRLAMVAWIGYFVQEHITHDGPVANLFAHLADPVHVTWVQSLQSYTP